MFYFPFILGSTVFQDFLSHSVLNIVISIIISKYRYMYLC